jgi:lactose/L-arabinose transport system substrate-binding protein
MKKLIILLLAGIVLLSACSSGSKGTSENGDDNELTAWAWDPKFNIAALELAEESYAKEDDAFDLNIIENAQDDIVQKLNTGLSSGTMKGMPNIVLIEDYRAQSFLQAYPDAFYDMSDYLNIDDFSEYKKEPTSFDGKHYGVPFDTGVVGLYLRTDYLEEAGYTIDDFNNITWDQFIEIGKDVKKKIDKPMLSLDPNDLGTIRMMIQSAGSWYLESDGVTPDLANNQALKEAFRVYKEMLDEDIATIHSDWSQLLAGFNDGKVVGVAQGNWITPSIKAEESQSGDWAVAPIPKLDLPDAVNASNLGGSSFYVLNIPGKEKAAEFLQSTFGSNVDFYQDLVTDVGAIGTYSPASSGEAYNDKDEFFKDQAIVSDFSSWVDDIIGVNYGMHTYAIEDILIAEMQQYLKGQDIDDVMKDSQQQADAQLN